MRALELINATSPMKVTKLGLCVRCAIKAYASQSGRNSTIQVQKGPRMCASIKLLELPWYLYNFRLSNCVFVRTIGLTERYFEMEFTTFELDNFSAEKEFVEHLFKVCSFKSSRTPNVNAIWSLNNPILSTDFSKANANKNRMNCWKLLNHGKPINPEDWACHLASSPEWRKFSQGDIQMSMKSSKSIFAAVLCSVATGRSLYLQDFIADHSMEDNVLVPSGYDSVHFLEHGKHSRTFCVPESGHALPLFVVLFTVQDAKKQQEREMCSFCGIKTADVYCISDKASLCLKCDKKVHEANILVQKHERVPIDEKEASETDHGFCSEHSQVQLQFFCESCRIPVCVHCKMVGNHSSGQASLHKLISIKEAYHNAAEQSQKKESKSEQRKNQLDQLISQLEGKLQSIAENAETVKQKIRDKVTALMEEIDEIHKIKADTVLSEKSELERQISEMNAIEEYIQKHQKMSKPIAFLHEFKCHTHFKKSIEAMYPQDVSTLVSLSDRVHPDLNVKGKLEITSEVISEAMEQPETVKECLDDNASMCSKFSLSMSLKDSVLHDLNNTKFTSDAKRLEKFSNTLSCSPEDFIYNSLRNPSYRYNNESLSYNRRSASTNNSKPSSKASSNDDMWKSAWMSRNNALI